MAAPGSWKPSWRRTATRGEESGCRWPGTGRRRGQGSVQEIAPAISRSKPRVIQSDPREGQAAESDDPLYPEFGSPRAGAGRGGTDGNRDMARKLRLEFPGAIHHAINRGNYLRRIGAEERTKAAFDACLYAADERSGWRLHAHIVVSNHFHLALERALETRDPRIEDGRSGKKLAPGKLAIAAWLKANSDARTDWIAVALSLGAPAALSRNLTHFRRHQQSADLTWRRLASVSAT